MRTNVADKERVVGGCGRKSTTSESHGRDGQKRYWSSVFVLIVILIERRVFNAIRHCAGPGAGYRAAQPLSPSTSADVVATAAADTRSRADHAETASSMEYGPIPKFRYDEVIKHLRGNFFPDEPLNKSVGLCRRGEPHALLEAHSLDTLKDEMSVMALDVATNTIAGVALNGVLRKCDMEKAEEKLKHASDEKFRQIFSLLNNINKSIDLFKKYRVDSVFEFRIASVDNKYRGLGIARQLMLRSELIAEEYGFQVFKVDATSYFSQRAAEAQGLKVIKEVRYSDYKDENGRPMFPTEPPHDTLKVMIKLLEPSSSG